MRFPQTVSAWRHRARAAALGAALFVLPRLAGQVCDAPTTVKPGAWLLESDLVAISFDRHTFQRDGVHFRSTYLGSALVSTGVTAQCDVQVGLECWREELATGPDWQARGRGVGDVWLRCKWNFAGDEATGPAWALLPHLKLPLADRSVGNGRTEPGLLLVHGRPLSEGRWLNAMLGVDWLDDGTDGRAASYQGALVCGWPLVSGFGAYAEALVSVNDVTPGEWTGEGGLGLTWTARRGLTLDLALYAGLTRAAPDWTPVLRLNCPW